MLGECPRMAELVTQGLIIYDDITCKFFMKDKRGIFHRMGECLYEAAIRTASNRIDHDPLLPLIWFQYLRNSLLSIRRLNTRMVLNQTQNQMMMMDLTGSMLYKQNMQSTKGVS